MTKEHYKTQPQYTIDRVDDKEYKKNSEAKKPFEVFTGEDSGLCGNVKVYFKRNKATLTSDYDFWKNNDYMSSYKQISSALALYRSISLFKCGLNASECDFYKVNWFIKLKHKETGLILGLGEWKGGFQIFTPAYSLKELPKAYIKDVERLLTQLVSPKMPIGYDGTVAGSVA